MKLYSDRHTPRRNNSGDTNRPIKSFRDEESNMAISVWPARDDPEQPRFKVDARFKTQDGQWMDKKFLFFYEAVGIARALHGAIAWACQEAGEPMPSLTAAPSEDGMPLNSQMPAARREFREPGEVRSEFARRSARGEEYQPPQHQPLRRSREAEQMDDDEIPF